MELDVDQYERNTKKETTKTTKSKGLSEVKVYLVTYSKLCQETSRQIQLHFRY